MTPVQFQTLYLEFFPDLDEVTVTFDLWSPKSNQLISES